jgi:SAM-dependent methyltransferase
MGFEDVMQAVSSLMVATDALAAIGAQLSLEAPGAASGDPATAEALRNVCVAAGVGDLAELEPPQRMMLAGVIGLCFGQAADLLGQPERPAGWTFTDPAVLEGIGRGSMLVVRLMAALPELEKVRSLLDVGVGVGWLAVAAAQQWPAATITGIDIWEPSLERARTNIRTSGLEDRVELRRQDVMDLDDVDAYDCAWLPTFFIARDAVATAVGNVVRAVEPGGHVVLGRYTEGGGALVEATTALRTVRGGGTALSADECLSLLRDAGCVETQAARRDGPMPLQLVTGRKP